jgi:hypothetical protein
MDIDATFLPVANTLVNDVFPTPIIYREAGSLSYDPVIGNITVADADYNINAGVLGRKRVEEGGSSACYELMLWVSHSTLPIIPSTGDQIIYDNLTWKVTAVDPIYSSAAPIASKITVRSS